MSYERDRLSDYVDVAARIAEFRERYPEGSLQPADPSQPYRIEQIGDKTYIVVVAAAYRTPDDPRPGIGMAYEQWPGRTPYTRDSELQNAETSAWGRAIVAALAADTRKGIASADEVRNRQAERDHAPVQQDRQQLMDGARRAISEAAESGRLDAIARQIGRYEQDGRLSAQDAAELRRLVEARRRELSGESWAEPATPGGGS